MQRSTLKVLSPHRRKGHHPVRHRSRCCLSRLRGVGPLHLNHRPLSESQQGRTPRAGSLNPSGFCPRRCGYSVRTLSSTGETAWRPRTSDQIDRAPAQAEEVARLNDCVNVHFSRSRIIAFQQLDIAEYTDSDHNPMIPHTLVLEPWPVCLHDLQRLLVFRPDDRRGSAPRLTCRSATVPTRLGHQQHASASCVGQIVA